jgi:hypothetical protein
MRVSTVSFDPVKSLTLSSREVTGYVSASKHHKGDKDGDEMI